MMKAGMLAVMERNASDYHLCTLSTRSDTSALKVRIIRCPDRDVGGLSFG